MALHVSQMQTAPITMTESSSAFVCLVLKMWEEMDSTVLVRSNCSCIHGF